MEDELDAFQFCHRAIRSIGSKTTNDRNRYARLCVLELTRELGIEELASMGLGFHMQDREEPTGWASLAYLEGWATVGLFRYWGFP